LGFGSTRNDIGATATDRCDYAELFNDLVKGGVFWQPADGVDNRLFVGHTLEACRFT
jgi:hypothetical protein